jgi:ubiquinone/menaquinone biosynthesis C-methylase UbiE
LADPELSPAQKVMNSRVFASIYETPIWRPLHTWIGSGISMGKEVEEVLDMSTMENVEMVVDLACGTGHYARAFARELPGAEIYGVDISLGMLVQGHRMAQNKGLSTIRFIRGDIQSLPFSDNSVDQVNCSGALHLFPKLEPIWKEVARVLKPGGIFTAMTLTFAGGVIGKVQQRIMDRGRATFFDISELAWDLQAAGFSTFKYKQHRVSLIFCATKNQA